MICEQHHMNTFFYEQYKNHLIPTIKFYQKNAIYYQMIVQQCFVDFSSLSC